MTRVFLTGAGGFIGSHVLEMLLAATDHDVVATDSFRHKGKTDRIALLLGGHPEWRDRLTVVTHDLTVPVSEQMATRIGPVDHVIAMASESHVPRSIADPVSFVQNNVNLALSTLEYCRQAHPKTVVWISSDEVYGALGPRDRPHQEWATILPSSPYSASKAAQEALAISYWRTYGLPVIIVNCANLIGERQDGEKFVPLIIRTVLSGGTVKMHSSGGEAGSRYYLHAANLADALLHILARLPASMYGAHAANFIGKPSYVGDRPDRYHVIGADQISNTDLARQVADLLSLPLHYQLVPSDRPGHDLHYGLDGSKLAAAGWKPPLAFGESLARIVGWYLEHREWLAP